LVSFGLERGHVDDEAILHVRYVQPFVSFVDLLDRDYLDLGADRMGTRDGVEAISGSSIRIRDHRLSAEA